MGTLSYNGRGALEAAIRLKESKFREMLLAGARMSDLEEVLARECHISSKTFLAAARAVMPDLPELLRLSSECRQRAAEEAIIADYRSGMAFKDILKKHHIGGVRLRGIIKKNGSRERGADIGAAKKGANLRRYEKAVGTIVNGLQILEILPDRYGKPPRCLVECVDCGERFTETAHKVVIRRIAVCQRCAEEEERELEKFAPYDSLPAAVVDSRAKITCAKSVVGCVISELLHLCCRECSFLKKGKCRHDHCTLDSKACGCASERKMRK